MATALSGLFGNGIVDAFYCCQTPIEFFHFGMKGERSFVCGNRMGPAQPNRTLVIETFMLRIEITLSSMRVEHATFHRSHVTCLLHYHVTKSLL